MKITATQFDKGIIKIYDTLYRLGLTANYTGFFYISYAVWLVMENQNRLLLVTKWLYPEVAKTYETTWGAVERCIRYAIAQIWAVDPDRTQTLFRVPVYTKPSPAKFLALLAKYCMTDSAA